MIPKQHHFVPKWYLERFVDRESGLIHVYDKPTAQFRAQKTSKVMKRNNYYRQDWAANGTDPNILEKMLGDFLEPGAKHALERLLTMPSDFTPHETALLLLYMEFQRIRVPRQAQTAKQLAESKIFMCADSRAFSEGPVVISESMRFTYMREMAGRISPYFTRMQWDIVRAANGSSFITTDSPVSFYNRDAPPPFEAGLRCVGTKVLFPVSSEAILIMRHPEYRPDSTMSPKALVPELQKGDWGIKIDFYPVPIDEQEVSLYNSCLFQLSDRTIAGSSRRVLEKCLEVVDSGETEP